MWSVGKFEDGSHFEAQSYGTEEERLAIHEAIQTDADNTGIVISIDDMTEQEYRVFMSQ